jgi:hypothetical protein
MNINDRRTNLSPRAARIISHDITGELLEEPQLFLPRFSSASTALGVITSRLASFGALNSEDAKAAARRRQSDAVIFQAKVDILMKNPVLFARFKGRLAASKAHAPILVQRVLREFLVDIKIPELQDALKKEALARQCVTIENEIQDALKKEALARQCLPIDNDSRDHFKSSLSSIDTKRIRNNSITVVPTLSMEEGMCMSPLKPFSKPVIEEPTDDSYDSSDEETSLSDDSSYSSCVSSSSSSYASYVSDSGDSHQSERLEV